ncbi:MAG: hypothetical protein IJL80_05080 [Treponema sp.]|nr:hypothetical protein [Treponema sp.]
MTIVAIVVAVALSVGVVSCRKSPPLPGDESEPIGLLEASRQNNAKRVKKLLKDGMNKDKQDDAGADVNAKNEQGMTALSIAEEFGNSELAALLRKAMAR